jgi:hypothetical protein
MTLGSPRSLLDWGTERGKEKDFHIVTEKSLELENGHSQPPAKPCLSQPLVAVKCRQDPQSLTKELLGTQCVTAEKASGTRALHRDSQTS